MIFSSVFKISQINILAKYTILLVFILQNHVKGLIVKNANSMSREMSFATEEGSIDNSLAAVEKIGEEPRASKQFRGLCHENKIYPDPTSTNKFYLCRFNYRYKVWIAYAFTCPNYMIFEPKEERCLYEPKLYMGEPWTLNSSESNQNQIKFLPNLTTTLHPQIIVKSQEGNSSQFIKEIIKTDHLKPDGSVVETLMATVNTLASSVQTLASALQTTILYFTNQSPQINNSSSKINSNGNGNGFSITEQIIGDPQASSESTVEIITSNAIDVDEVVSSKTEKIPVEERRNGPGNRRKLILSRRQSQSGDWMTETTIGSDGDDITTEITLPTDLTEVVEEEGTTQSTAELSEYFENDVKRVTKMNEMWDKRSPSSSSSSLYSSPFSTTVRAFEGSNKAAAGPNRRTPSRMRTTFKTIPPINTPTVRNDHFPVVDKRPVAFINSVPVVEADSGRTNSRRPKFDYYI